jgi:hypothetical protein
MEEPSVNSFPAWQKIVALFAAATAVLVALTIFLDKIPDFLQKSERAYTAFHGLFSDSKAELNMAPQTTPSSVNDSDGSKVRPSADVGPSELGPPPHAGCHEVASADFSQYPPRYSRSWSC